MRQCTTCGRTYPNEVDECEYDGSPLFDIGDTVEEEPLDPPQGRRSNIFGSPQPATPVAEKPTPEPTPAPTPSSPVGFGAASSPTPSPSPLQPVQPKTPWPVDQPATPEPAPVFPDVSALNQDDKPPAPTSEPSAAAPPTPEFKAPSNFGAEPAPAKSVPPVAGPPSLDSIPNIPAAPTLGSPSSHSGLSSPPVTPSAPPPTTPGSSPGRFPSTMGSSNLGSSSMGAFGATAAPPQTPGAPPLSKGPAGGPPKSRPLPNAKSDADSLLAGIDEELGNFEPEDDFPSMYDPAPPAPTQPPLSHTGTPEQRRTSLGAAPLSIQKPIDNHTPAARSFSHKTPTDFPAIQPKSNFPDSKPITKKESNTNFIMIGGLILSIIGAALALIYILFFANPIK